MTNPMAVVLAASGLTGLAACDDPTRPADPSVTPPAAAAAAVEQQFTVRNLGTLGGTFSFAIGINERAEVVGVCQTSRPGNIRAFLWRAGRACEASARWAGRTAGPSASTTAARSSASARSARSEYRAFLWSEARGMRGLGTWAVRTATRNAINNRREVVGVSEKPNGATEPSSGVRGAACGAGHAGRA